MSISSERVKSWRRRTKERIIEAMGGECVCCSYKRCPDALELHHIDPTSKEFSLAGARGHPIAWAKLVVELRKCVLLCANCHREVEAVVRVLPKRYRTFNEAFVEYRRL